jgi:glucose/arabinose dehydrogenase
MRHKISHQGLFTILILIVLAAVGCSPAPQNSTVKTIMLRAAQATPPPSGAHGLTLPTGYTAEKLTSALNAPTHLALGPDGLLYITQLNGGENDGRGQVVRIGRDGSLETVLDGLFKPVGLTFAGGSLYVAAGSTILISRPKDGSYAPPEPFVSNIPFNGRSIGQIFTSPDGLIYYQSTGNETIPNTSGQILTIKPDGGERRVYARGLKNAYAMAWDAKTQQMFATEIGDGYILGVGPFPEEINRIQRGGSYGWPLCYGKQLENRAAGGKRAICADTDPALVTFPASSTPTGLAVLDGKLIVALWNGSPPALFSVDPATAAAAPFASGFARPIALLTTTDNALLVLDQDDGALWRLRRQ